MHDSLSTAAKPVKSHSQNIEGINIGDGNSDIGFNQLQVDRGSSVNQNKTEATLQNADVQEALKLLSILKQDIVASNSREHPLLEETPNQTASKPLR